MTNFDKGKSANLGQNQQGGRSQQQGGQGHQQGGQTGFGQKQQQGGGSNKGQAGNWGSTGGDKNKTK